jgi:ABC-2 type transport system ATP-binding protein
MDKKVTALSKGMRQRINLGRTLLHDPQLLLLDEPAAGLDPQARRDLRELLKVLAGEDKTILISSHILAELEGLVDKVAIINEGELVYSGAPEDRKRPDGRMSIEMRLMGDLKISSRLLLETPAVIDVKSSEPDLLRVELKGSKKEIAGLVRRLVEHDQVPYAIVTEGKLLETMFLEVTRDVTDLPTN